MKTRRVELRRLDTGTRESADLMVCPDCSCEQFLVYVPAEVGHIHYQCFSCGVSFCDNAACGATAGNVTREEFNVLDRHGWFAS